MQLPEAWKAITDILWSMPEADAKALWWAITRSRWHRPVAFRQQLSLIGHVRLDTLHCARHLCTPAAMVALIEDLVQERQLRRTHATRLEEYILWHVDRHGCWKGEPWDGRAASSTLPPDVRVFWQTGASEAA